MRQVYLSSTAKDLKIYRDAGGKRAILANVIVDLAGNAEGMPLGGRATVMLTGGAGPPARAAVTPAERSQLALLAAPAAGLSVLTVGVSSELASTVLAAAVGFQHNQVAGAAPDAVYRVLRLVEHCRVVGVSETGLDRNRETAPFDQQ